MSFAKISRFWPQLGPDGRYLTSVDHARAEPGRDACLGLRAEGPKDNILVNGFRAWTLCLGCENCPLGVELCIDLSLAGSRAHRHRPRSRPACCWPAATATKSSLATNAKANQPVPPKLVAAMVEKDMDLQSPILVRLFKQEAELEVWKQDRSGRFALLKTYPICRWSGDLGPEGPRRRPPGAGRLLLDHAGADEPAVGLLSLVQHRLSRTPIDRALGRTGSRADGAWRLLVARLLRDDRRADRGNLFAGARVLLRRPEGVPVPGLSVPDDAAEHGQAPQQSEHAVLEDDQGRLRSFRGDAAGAEGRFLREEIRVRRGEGAGCQARSGVRRLGQMPGLCDPR